MHGDGATTTRRLADDPNDRSDHDWTATFRLEHPRDRCSAGPTAITLYCMKLRMECDLHRNSNGEGHTDGPKFDPFVSPF